MLFQKMVNFTENTSLSEAAPYSVAEDKIRDASQYNKTMINMTYCGYRNLKHILA